MAIPIHELGEIRVGVECCIKHKNEILLQKRSSDTKYFPNYLAFPGGHTDEGENILESCIREVREETGIDISKGKIEFVVNTLNNHVEKGVVWIIFAFRVEMTEKSEPISTEEGECKWYEIEAIDKSQIVPPVQEYFETLVNSTHTLFTSATYRNGGLENITLSQI